MTAEVTDRIALIDLDGTVADYDGSMQVEMRKLMAPGEPAYNHRPVLDVDEVGYMRARRKLIQQRPGFWRDLLCLHTGMQVVHELHLAGFALHVLTKGPKDCPNAWGEKVEWSRKYLPDALVTVTGDKSLFYGRVLFDDWPPYFEKWLIVRPRALVICLAHPWNEEYAPGGPKAHPNVLRYDGTNVEEMVRRIRAAYDREAGAA